MTRSLITLAIVAMALLGCNADIPGGSEPENATLPVPAPANVTAPAPSLSENESVLYGIRLGLPIADARRLLVNPVYEQSAEEGAALRQGAVDKGVTVFYKNEIVTGVLTFVGSTPRGLAIGDPVSQVTTLYGEPDEVNKYGWMRYMGTDGFALQITTQDGAVRSVAIGNARLAEPKPDLGREIVPKQPVAPFGIQDHYMMGIELCSDVIALRGDTRLVETKPYPSNGQLEFKTPDKYIRIVTADQKSSRVDRIEVTGGLYETVRGVRIGDPISRVQALYGQTEDLSDGQVSLVFHANLNGRIEWMRMTCIQR